MYLYLLLNLDLYCTSNQYRCTYTCFWISQCKCTHTFLLANHYRSNFTCFVVIKCICTFTYFWVIWCRCTYICVWGDWGLGSLSTNVLTLVLMILRPKVSQSICTCTYIGDDWGSGVLPLGFESVGTDAISLVLGVIEYICTLISFWVSWRTWTCRCRCTCTYFLRIQRAKVSQYRCTCTCIWGDRGRGELVQMVMFLSALVQSNPMHTSIAFNLCVLKSSCTGAVIIMSEVCSQMHQSTH